MRVQFRARGAIFGRLAVGQMVRVRGSGPMHWSFELECALAANLHRRVKVRSAITLRLEQSICPLRAREQDLRGRKVADDPVHGAPADARGVRAPNFSLSAR